MSYQPLTKEDIEDFDNLIFEVLCNDYEDGIEEELRKDHNKNQNDILFSRFVEMIKSGELSLDDYFNKLKNILKCSHENGDAGILEKFNEYFGYNYIAKSDMVGRDLIFQILDSFWYIKNCIENNLEIVVDNNIYENCYFFIIHEYSHFSKLKIHNLVNSMSDYEKYVYIKEEILPQFRE